MKIVSAEFVKSAFSEADLPREGLPEIAFLGRSNVGKSSLINALLQRRGLARTSNTPGRTQSLNYFLINERFYFVDLPGYGYARVSKEMRRAWGEFITNYLAKRASLVLSIHIVDSRHEPTQLDAQLHEWLGAFSKPFLTVATKSDKLSHNELGKSLARAARTLYGDEARGADKIIAFSAETRRGRDQIWRAIYESLDRSTIPLLKV